MNDKKSQFLKWWEKGNQKISGIKDLCLGIDRGTHTLRYILVNRSKKQILRWGSFESQPVAQESGAEKKEIHKTSLFIRDLAKIIPKKQLCSIHTNLRDPSVLIGHFHIPAVKKEERSDAIKVALREKIPFPLEEAAYSCREYHIADPKNSTPQSEKERKITFNFVAVPKQVIVNTIHPIEDAFPLIPEVTPEGYAQESLFEFLNLPEVKEPIAIIDIGKSSTAVTIFQDKKLVFERDIPLAGQDFTRAILILRPRDNSPRSSFDLDLAEKLKQESFIPSRQATSEPLGQEDDNRKIFSALEGVLNAWIQDLRLSFQFFNEHYGPQKVSKIYLIGGGANFKNLPHYLTSELETPTELLSFPKASRINLPEFPDPESFKAHFHEYALALALAFEPDGNANLTPPEFFAGRLQKFAAILVRIGSVLAAAFLLTWFFFMNTKIHALRDMKALLSEQRKFLEQVEKPYLEMLNWEKFLRNADGKTPSASRIFKVMSRRIPSNILLSKLSIERDYARMTLEGFVYGDARKRAITMAEFSKALKDSNNFENIEIPLLEPYQAQNTVGNFRLTAELVNFVEESNLNGQKAS